MPSSDRLVSWVRGQVAARRRRAAVTALLVVATAGLGFYALVSWEARGPKLRALEAYNRFDFHSARNELRDYLRSHPGDSEAQFVCARACRRAAIEDFEGARLHLQEADRLGWPSDEVALELALLDYQSGPNREREDVLRRALDRAADPTLIWEALARGSLRAGLPNKANAALDDWIDHAPDDWYPRLWRGALFQHLGRPQLAVADYRVVLAHRPDDPAVQRRLGLVLAESGTDYAEALRFLESAGAVTDSDADGLAAAAQCCRVLRRIDESRKLLQRALQARPNHVEALMTLALLELDGGNAPAALAALERAEKAGDDSESAVARLLRLDPVTHSPHLTERHETILHLRAASLRLMDRVPEAEECETELRRLRAALAKLNDALRDQRERPRDADLMYRIAELYLAVGSPRDGQAWLLRALDVDPDHVRARAGLAEFRRRGKGS